MERMPFVRHPWYPQGGYLHRGGRLHAPVPDPMGAFGEDYTYGSFSSKTPYAYVPKHTGLDGYYSHGTRGYGATAEEIGEAEKLGLLATDPCGIEAAQTWLVDKLCALPPISGLIAIDFTGEVKTGISQAVGAATSATLGALLAQAKLGVGAASGYFASNMASPLAAALAKTGAPVNGTMLANLFQSQVAAPLVTWLTACAQKTKSLGPTSPSPQVPMTQMYTFETLYAQGLPANTAQALSKSDAIQQAIRSGELQLTSLYAPDTTVTTTGTVTAGGGGAGVAILGGVALLALLLLR